MIKGFLKFYEQNGALPLWNLYGWETNMMIGYHAVPVIVDTYLKGIGNFDPEKALEACIATANRDDYRGIGDYKKLGYVPAYSDPKKWENWSLSKTLEYAYDDFVLSQVAKKLGKTDDYKALIKRAENYRNVIDPETGYARGRHADGTWIEPFDPFASTSFICEGTPYHYTWYAPQDIAGLIRHMGGKERFINRLDTFFEGDYYWHGNEPGHHIAYLFAYAGEPWKTQKWVHDIINREYFTTPDGLSGNDDAGQMSSWLVFQHGWLLSGLSGHALLCDR